MKRILTLILCILVLLAAVLFLLPLLPLESEYLHTPPAQPSTLETGAESGKETKNGRLVWASEGKREEENEADRHPLPAEPEVEPGTPAPPPRTPSAGGEGGGQGSPDLERRENPFENERNLGPEMTVVFQLRYGRFREDRPLPQSFDNPYFWRSITLDEAFDQDGNPRNVVKLPFPGPPHHYLIWEGRIPKLAESPRGWKRRPLACGIHIGARNQAHISRPVPEGQSCGPYLYEFLALHYVHVDIGGTRRELVEEESRFRLRIRSNTYLECKLDGKKIVLCDDNANGIFGDEGTREAGNSPRDLSRQGCDTVTVGSGRSARSTLFGSLVHADGKLYVRRNWDPETWTLTVREYVGPTGRLRVRPVYRRTLPRFLLLGIETGRGEIGFMNVGNERRPLSLPPGTYFLKWGLLCAHRFAPERERVEIFPGSFADIVVKENWLVDLALGGSPLTAEIPVNMHDQGRMAEIQTYKMVVKGKGGEEYRRIWGKPLSGPIRVYDSRNVRIFEGKLREVQETEPLLPTAGGVNQLLFARPLFFELPFDPAPKPPLRLRFTWRHRLLGIVSSP